MKNEKKFRKFDRITLIQGTIVIIIVLILLGIVMNLAFKGNIIIKKNQTAEKYEIEEIRENINTQIESSITKETSLGNDVTIDRVLQELVTNKTFESIDKETNTGNIGEYQIKLKQDENENIIIEDIKKAEGMRITYTLDPVSYTNKDKVSILFKVEGNIKSITKPDGLVIYSNKNILATDYEVDKNGTYQFIVEDTEGTKITKNVIVDTIDKLAPKDFEITAVGTTEKIEITGTTEDAQSDELNVKSGIERYEYYVKQSSATNYTKYESNEITGLFLGNNYSIYVVAYDKAGNSKQSEVVNITIKSIVFLNVSKNFGFGSVMRNSGWNVVGSYSPVRLSAKIGNYANNPTCYTYKSSKVDVSDLNKITFICEGTGATSSGDNGVCTFGLVNEPSSNDFIIEVSTPIGYYISGRKKLILDTSSIQGEYYIKIRLKTANDQEVYMQGDGIVYGE